MELIGDGTGSPVPNAGFSLTSPSQPRKTEPSSSGGELLDLLGELHQPPHPFQVTRTIDVNYAPP